MTIEDEDSIYVGNLPYEATEVTVRCVFDVFGQIIQVRMIKDHEVGGKCYCFVTFTNPRSAIDAIKDMDGQKVEGRILRVNEAKSKGGRSNFGRPNFRPNNNRDLELDKGRYRDRGYGRVRDRSWDQNREWSGDRDQGKERGYDRARDIDRTGERFIDRNGEHDRDKDMNTIESEGDRDQTDRDYRSGNKFKDGMTRDQNREWSRDRNQGKERGYDRARDIDRTGDRFIDRDREHDPDKDMNTIESEGDRDQTDRDYRSGNTYKDEATRDQNSEWSRDRDQGKERGFDRARDIDRTREGFIDRERRHDQDKNMESIEHDHERDRDQTNRDQRSGNKYKDESSKLTNGSDFSERHGREHPSASSHGDHDQVAKQLDVSHQKIQELQKEVLRMEELVKERGDHVSKLQEKSEKLEDALASAKKLTSNRKKQLTKLHKCFLNMKEYGEKLRSSEDELQSLVGSTMNELDYHNGLDTDGLLANGNA